MMVVPRSLSSSGDKEKMTIEAVNSHQELCENITNIEVRCTVVLPETIFLLHCHTLHIRSGIMCKV